METVLLVVIVVLGAALVLVSFSMVNVVKGLKSTVDTLEKRVSSLQEDLATQQKNLDDIRSVIQRKPEDPFTGVLSAVGDYRKRGLWPALAMVGVRVFRSYLNNRARQKALPVLDKRARSEK